MLVYLGVAVLFVLGFAMTLFLWRRGGRRGGVDFPTAREQFVQSLPRLQNEFFTAASKSGKPRGLRWKDCVWSDAIAFARDRQSGLLLALVGATFSFEAIEGGDMEGVEAVGNLRDSSAVFFFDAGWRTVGRVVFNLSPEEAIDHFKTTYERIATPG